MAQLDEKSDGAQVVDDRAQVRARKNLYLREWRARKKQENPEGVREANKKAYMKMRSNPEVYQRHVARVKSAYVPRVKPPRPPMTAEEIIAKRRRDAEKKKQYWANNPERYKAHLLKCAQANKNRRQVSTREPHEVMPEVNS